MSDQVGKTVQQYRTIRALSRLPNCPVSEPVLRKLVQEGKITGFHAGRRLYTSMAEVEAVLKEVQA